MEEAHPARQNTENAATIDSTSARPSPTCSAITASITAGGSAAAAVCCTAVVVDSSVVDSSVVEGALARPPNVRMKPEHTPRSRDGE